mmetsp:Transcript_3653/g.11289  ORF Transcript_3653/g.11289 Transcript_3653/m.11289 type:complete len:383 (+) Transcript_3653:22-1170(+)
MVLVGLLVAAAGQTATAYMMMPPSLLRSNNVMNKLRPATSKVAAATLEPTKEELDARAVKVATLQQHNADLPLGIAEELVKSAATFGTRYLVVDNSGSMATGDGHRLVSRLGHTGMVSCSRWDELGTSLGSLARVAVDLGAKTEFRMLNAPANGSAQVVKVGGEGTAEEVQLRQVNEMVAAPPGGGTPLCKAVEQVVKDIRAQRGALERAGKRAHLVIASDGEATDGDMAKAMKPLHDLPCSVVVRLCTDEDHVVDYWNNVDKDLELELDILDDLKGEAKEINAKSPFFTYGPAFHGLREFGTAVKLADLIDERSLNRSEILELATLIFGKEAAAELPHPDLDLKGFCDGLDRIQENAPQPWNPLTNCRTPWFDTGKLAKAL